MKQLSQHELDSKIQSFLNERFSVHPELSGISSVASKESVVSRVKNITKKFQLSRSVRSQPALHI